MKLLVYTLLTIFIPVLTHAQLTQPDAIGGGDTPDFSVLNKAAGDSCGVYHNNYVGLNKTSIIYIEELRMGTASASGTYGGRAQRFHAPQPIEVHGLSFYAFEENPSVDSLMLITHLYDYEPVGDTIGALLAVDTVWVTHQAYSAVLPDIQVNSYFDSPVTVTDEYMIAVITEEDDSLRIIVSDFGNGDGQGEGVSYLLYNNPNYPSFIGWYSGYGDFGPVYDGDYLMNPIVKFDLHDDFLVLDDSICPNVVGAGCVDYTQKPIYSDYHYNGYASTPTNHILWLWGDGFQNTNLTTACHTYTTSGDFDITLQDSLRRHVFNSPYCIAEVTNPIHVIPDPVASATYTQSGTIVDFTNTSMNADSVWWDFDDTTAGSNQLNPSHDFGTIDTFNVMLIAYNECTSDTTYIQIITDDVGFEDYGLNFTIYPNPANQSVQLSGIIEGAQVELLNLMGQTVYRQKSTSNLLKLDTSPYSNGTYFIRISTETGQSTKKLIITH